MSYATIHRTNERFLLTVLFILIVAFVFATILMFLHPTGALTIFVLGLGTVFIAALIERGFKYRERTAIRQALGRNECPQCGAGVTATGGEWSCAGCGSTFQG